MPWQVNATPYRVWLSEVMLQQTQVSTVLAYFDRFTQKFPTIQHLAQAAQDDVLFLWSGLGYYSRARNLHKCAKIIQEQYHGEWPMDVALLEKLPGIGRSTAGAIVSLSKDYFAPILDGNVKRVLCRFFAIETPVEKQLWEKAEQLTSKSYPKNYNQAMMDLGATVCTRTKPRCPDCPLQENCTAYAQEKSGVRLAQEYPKKKSKPVLPVIYKQFLLLSPKEKPALWLYKRPPVGIWAGLWSLPELEMEENATSWLTQKGFHVLNVQPLPAIKHNFSHFTLHLHPIHILVEEQNSLIEENNSGFFSLEKPWPGGLAAPIHLTSAF